MRTETKELQYPLPPEGQPVPKTDASIGFFGGGSGDGGDGGGEDDEDAILKARPRMVGKDHERPPSKFWQEGWYLWASKSKYGAQEKIDLMMCDLERQTDWMKYKKQVNEEYETFERAKGKEGVVGSSSAGSVPASEEQEGQSILSSSSSSSLPQPLHPASIQDRELPPAPPQPPFPDVA